MIACVQSAVTKLFRFVTYFKTKLILTTLNYVLKMFGHVNIILKKCFGNKCLFYKLKLFIQTSRIIACAQSAPIKPLCFVKYISIK